MKISKNSKGIGWEKENDVNIDGENIDLTSYAKKTDIPTRTGQLTNDSGFITEIPSEYITEDELNAKGYLTQHQDISNKADRSEIPTRTSQLENNSGFITEIPAEYITETELSTELANKANTSDIPSLDGYATETFVTNKIAEASLSGGAVDLSGYATKDELNTKANVSDIPTNTSQLQNVVYVAHRGYSSGAPDNTIPAYELAAKLGYMAVEADICETSDGNFVLMHDETVDNMTNGTGNVKDLTLEQIKALTIDNGNGIENYPNLKVPTLQEFLQVCHKYSLIPVLDIRPFTNYENFLNIVIGEGFEHSCIILDSFINQLKHIRSLNTNVSLMSLAEISIEDCLKYNIGIDLVYTHEWMTETNIKNAIDNGIEVGIWTVNDKSIAEFFIGYGVRYLTTDQLQLDSIPGFRVHELETNFDTLEERVSNPYFIEAPLVLKYVPGTVVGVRTLSFTEGTGTSYYPTNFKIYSDSTGRAISEAIPSQGCYNVNVHFDTNYKVTLYCYDKDNRFIQDLGWFTSDTDKQLPTTTVFYQIYAAKVDGTYFTSDDLNTLAKSIRITYLKNDANSNCISYATETFVLEQIAKALSNK